MIEQELREALEGALDHVRPPIAELILDAQSMMMTPGRFAALPSDDDSTISPHQDEGQRSD